MDGRQLSCKRKSLETLTGQSSLNGNSSFHGSRDNIPHVLPSGQSTSLNISHPLRHSSNVRSLEQLNPTVEGHYSLSVGTDVGSSQINYRMRMNPMRPRELSLGDTHRARDSLGIVSPLHPPGNQVSGLDVHLDWRSLIARTTSTRNQFDSPNPPSSRVYRADRSMELRSLVVDNSSTHDLSEGTYPPSLDQTLQTLGWNAVANSGAGNSLLNATTNERIAISPGSYVIPVEQLTDLFEERSSTSLSRSVPGHITLPPLHETRPCTQDPATRPSADRNVAVDTNLTSLPRSSSGTSGPTAGWMPGPRAVAHLGHRLSEVHEPLLPSSGSSSGGPVSSFPQSYYLSAIPLPEMVLPAGGGVRSHAHQFLQSAFFMDRAGDSIIGVPLSLRNRQEAAEGWLGLVSENPFILDRVVFNGITDLHDRHRDMRLDVDNMSYEELLALEERIGHVSTGLSEEAMMKCLKHSQYGSMNEKTIDAEPCCICQEEYVSEEELGTLDCGHDFHASCIKQWLMHKNLCPICKTTTGLVTKCG